MVSSVPVENAFFLYIDNMYVALPLPNQASADYRFCGLTLLIGGSILTFWNFKITHQFAQAGLLKSSMFLNLGIVPTGQS
mgnify:FL=1